MTNGLIVLTYLDAYKKERQISYDNLDHCLLAFSGCVTFQIPIRLFPYPTRDKHYLLLER